MTARTTLPSAIKAAQALFFLNAAIWLAFAIAAPARIARSTGQPLAAVVVAILMLGNAAAMLVAGLALARRTRWLYYFGIAVLLVNILLTFTDQFGLWDFITLALDVALLGLLIDTRSYYMRNA
jgi:hypothetical protein